MRHQKTFTLCGMLAFGSFILLWSVGRQDAGDSDPPTSASQHDPKPEHVSYYMVVFASQRGANEPRYSHTFATFVSVTGRGENEDHEIEIHTLSWLPKSLNIVILRAQTEPGINLDLQASLDWAASVQARVTAWGPYRIQEELYQAARNQIDRLNGGGIAYKAFKLLDRSEATNCIYALADIEQGRGLLSAGTAHGEAASQMVVRHFQRRIIHPEQTHDWMRGRLGLEKHAVTFKSFP